MDNATRKPEADDASSKQAAAKLVGQILQADGQSITILSYIDGGVYGEVLKVERQEKLYAMKIFKEFEDTSAFEKEKRLMLAYKDDADTNDHFLIPIVCGSELSEAPAGLTKCFILMDLMGPTVFEVMQNAKRDENDEEVLCGFTNSNIADMMRQVCEAMKYLHGLGILHLDLKPENIFFKSLDAKPVSFTSDGNVCIMEMSDTNIRVGDIGCGDFKDRLPSLNNAAQTQNYRAPEVFLGLPFDEKCDVWSFGCVMAEMYTGEVLFFGNDDDTSEPSQVDVIQCTLRAPIPYYMYLAAYLRNSPEVVLNKAGILVYSHSNTDPIAVKQLTACIRPGDTDAIPMFEILLKVLEIDPKKRPSFEEISADVNLLI